MASLNAQGFVIEYATGLRVIIHTANLIHIDCADKTQGLWWQDFPLKASASAQCSLKGLSARPQPVPRTAWDGTTTQKSEF